MIYGYIRVSSDRQTVENQRYEILRFCERERLRVDGWIEETVSGTRPWGERELGRLLSSVGAGDMIVCAELSRLGRSLFMIMEILGLCMERGCRVWTVKDGYRLGDDLQSKVLAFAFALSAEIERTLIAQRTREALARRRAEGMTLGRPRGSRTRRERHKLYGREALIARLLDGGVTQSEMARRLGVCRATLRAYIIRYMGEERNEVKTS